MNAIANRIAAFMRAAKTSPVRVHLHGKEVSKHHFADRVVIFACIASAGAALLTDHIYKSSESDNTIRAPHMSAPADPRSHPEVWDELEVPTQDTLRYVQVKFGEREISVLDEPSRLRLVKEAAAKHGLHQVGLNWKDLYGVIHAETNWIPRDGMGKNGVISSGLAQLEPATARAIGVSNPNDPRQAIDASAQLIREGAIWARTRISGLRLSPTLTAERLREGVSIYYNLSTRGRNAWDGQNTYEMPRETQLHIENSYVGSQIAARLERRLLATQKRQAAPAEQKSPARAHPMAVAYSSTNEVAPERFSAPRMR